MGHPLGTQVPPYVPVVCWSERASTRQHKKILVSGTTGAFRLCSDKRMEQFGPTETQVSN